MWGLWPLGEGTNFSAARRAIAGVAPPGMLRSKRLDLGPLEQLPLARHCGSEAALKRFEIPLVVPNKGVSESFGFEPIG